MKFTPLPLSGACRVDIEPQGDSRGFFARMFCKDEFAAQGLDGNWVQCNTSLSRTSGTIRGLHFQRPPAAEAKLIRCLRGSVFDVIVDIRKGSPTFGQWHGEVLDAENRSMLFVPRGFAHGFQTLTDNVEMLYFHTASFSPEHQGGVRWDDPQIAVAWPAGSTEISARDAGLPYLAGVEPVST
jgi:dTDP-4-dehydrorhamnose 3,5-epimerase